MHRDHRNPTVKTTAPGIKPLGLTDNFKIDDSALDITHEVLAAARWTEGVEMMFGYLIVGRSTALTTLGSAFSNLTTVHRLHSVFEQPAAHQL